MNHEWLWALLTWLAYRFHPDLVAWLNLGVLFVVFGIAYVVARQESRSTLAAGMAVWAAAATSYWFQGIAPQLISMAFLAVLSLTYSRTWSPWLWPPLMVLWTNLHGGFLFGLAVISLIVLVQTAEASWSEGRLVLPRRLWLGLLLACAAVLVNPWGYRIVEYPLSYLESASVFRKILEWYPPRFAGDLATYEGRFWWLAAVTALGLPFALRRARPLAAVAALTFAMGVTSRRFIPLFAIASIPVVALAFAQIVERARDRWSVLRGTLPRAVALTIAACLAIALWSQVRLVPHFLDRWTVNRQLPHAALDYLRSLGLPRRIFSDYIWGGHILLGAPEMKVFIDGRANTLYDERIVREYLRIISARPGFRTLLEAWEVDAVLVPSAIPVVRALTRGPESWKIVYRDALAAVLVPVDSPVLRNPLPVLDSERRELVLLEAQELLNRHQYDEARGRLSDLVGRDPLFIPAYRDLTLAIARTGDAFGMLGALAAGADAYPRGRRRLNALEGMGYEVLGDARRALRAYRRARPRGPFEVAPNINARIRALEEELSDWQAN